MCNSIAFAYICWYMKVGILGGGQLGRMLLQAAANYPVETFVLEQDSKAPAAHLCHHFIVGDIKNFDDVYAFGQKVDALTIEIENVNIEALEKLEQEGKKIFPQTKVLRTIKNKILQKQYYKEHSIPTAPFEVVQNKQDVAALKSKIPMVNKIGEGGYDGKGVVLIENEAALSQAFDAPGIIEELVMIQKELAVIVAVDQQGHNAIYPPVWMVFNNELNLLDFQFCPVEIPEQILWKVEAMALSVVKNFNSPGIFAVEFLLDTKGDVFVNETAPRVHNSGHHTIEGNYSSQFDMLWRVILNYPLGNTEIKMPSVLVNLVGADGFKGTPVYDGLNEVLQQDKLFVHIYGKHETKPGRKMGHVTILGKHYLDLMHEAKKVKAQLKVIA
jgi:5-(carboxyamino)imidazole ribonucleotide synthase